jgi:2-amino-4-hydroxy-6-hydroxymethyldihydropteridine diphosphokinase
VIGLGANLGDRRAAIEAAIGAIVGLRGVELAARSSLWRTTPVWEPGGGPAEGEPQPDFYNAAIAVRTRTPLIELMRELLAIEQRFGRVRDGRNLSRTLDLDLLWAEGEQVRVTDANGVELEVPHPRLHQRAFALVPLLEVAPGAADPATGRLYAAILEELGTEGVTTLDASSA